MKNPLLIRLSALIVLAGLLSFTSCKKGGCTDPLSKNYDAEAEKDDGSCEYYTNDEFITMDKWVFSSISITGGNQNQLTNWFTGYEATYLTDGTYSILHPADTANSNSSGVWEFHPTELALYHDKGTADESIILLTLLNLDSMNVVAYDTDSLGNQISGTMYLVHP